MKIETTVIRYKDLSVALKAYIFMPEADIPGINGARLRIEVEEAAGIPDELFLTERLEVEDYTNTADGELVEKLRNIAVAKVADMVTFQANAIDTSSDLPPFFRTNWFDMIFRNPEDMLLTWTDIQRDVAGLLKTYKELALA